MPICRATSAFLGIQRDTPFVLRVAVAPPHYIYIYIEPSVGMRMMIHRSYCAKTLESLRCASLSLSHIDKRFEDGVII